VEETAYLFSASRPFEASLHVSNIMETCSPELSIDSILSNPDDDALQLGQGFKA
jgi:hypothetical protein